jgi:amino acid adenylation domain-containing protein
MALLGDQHCPNDLVLLVDHAAATSAVQKAWSEVFGNVSFSPQENFFALGGDSLRALGVLSRLRDWLGIDLPASALFSHPTVQSLTELIVASDRPIPATPVQAPSPSDRQLLSYSQERIWWLLQGAGTNHAYQMQVAIPIEGPLGDGSLLQQALTILVQRHAILRTTFHSGERGPLQKVHPSFPVHLPLLDLSSVPDAEQEASVERAVAALAALPLEMDHLPLVRWQLLRLSPTRFRLLQVEHHLLHDGWSLHLLVKDLFQIHAALFAGELVDAPSPVLQFADIAALQRAYVESGAGQRQLEFWRNHLDGAPAELNFPPHRPAAALASVHGSVHRHIISPAISAPLLRICRQERATLFDGMLCCFALLMSRVSAQKDLVLGTGVATRRWREMEEVPGMLVNNLALRFQLESSDSFRDALRRTQEVKRAAFEHQDVPFDQVVRTLNPSRASNRHPLFQVMFSFHDSPLQELRSDAHQFERPHVFNNASAKFELSVIAIPAQSPQRSGAVELIWEYNTGLFTEARVQWLAEAYGELLQQLVRDPDAHAFRVSLLNQAQRHRLEQWGLQSVPYPREATMASLFAEVVSRHPLATALRWEGGELAYQDLDKRANRTARLLQSFGLGHGMVAALMLQRGPEIIILLLAILKCGAAYLALCPDDPEERLAFMLADGAADLLITEDEASSHFASACPQVFTLTSIVHQRARFAESEMDVPSLPTDRAYLAYTSGSTGRPKAAEIPQRAVIRLVRSSRHYHLGPSEVMLQCAPIAFDAATFEVWGALLNGAQLVLSPPVFQGLPALAACLRRHRITTLWLTATLFHAMVEHELESLLGVRQVLAGGEALSPAAVERMLQVMPAGHVLINGYGPTENTTFTCCCRLHRGSRIQGDVPIGQPIANSSVRILDEHLQQQPIGVQGFLYTGGDGLALGYYQRPELTAQKFVLDPFAPSSHSRLYNTGDLALWDEDGNLHFLGRQDEQVKIRGFRVETAEIEAQARQVDGVLACVVIAVPQGGAMTLVAFLVAQDPQSTPARVADHWRLMLPASMQPSTIHCVDQLPVTSHGKLDRRQLAAWACRKPEPVAAPRCLPTAEPNEDLVLVLEMLRAIPDLESIGAEDDFFLAGGHSLLAARVSLLISRRFAVAFEVMDLFRSPTPRGIARTLRERRPRSGSRLAGFRHLLPVQDSGSKPTLFFIPGGNGEEQSMVFYERLLPFCPERRFVAVLAVESSAPHDFSAGSIDELAERFAEEIIRLQPLGPYYIAGGCNGGVPAAATAWALERRGCDVAAVFLLDTAFPDLRMLLLQLLRHVCSLLRTSLLRRLDVETAAPGSRRRWLYDSISNCLPLDELWAPANVPMGSLRFCLATSRWRPRRLQSPIYLVGSATLVEKKIPTRWRRLTRRQLYFRAVPGDHLTFMREHMEATGLEWRRCLEHADAQLTPPARQRVAKR